MSTLEKMIEEKKCRKCGATIQKAICVAMLREMGCYAYGWCEAGKHDWDSSVRER